MIRFGTGGWRAVIGDDFIKDNVYKVGQAVYEYLKRHNLLDQPLMIGYDRRFLSRQAAGWLAEVLAGNGLKIWAMKRSAPTPPHHAHCQNGRITRWIRGNRQP